MTKTGPELMVELSAFPTLDLLLDRDPHAKPMSDAELELMVKRERAERAFQTFKQEAKKAKKQGVEELPEQAATEEETDDE